MKRENLPADGRPSRCSRPMLATLLSALYRMARVSRAILREIFDESAYQRFLERSCLESSVNSYALFQQENAQSKSRKPRCC